VKVDEKTHHTSICVTVKAGDGPDTVELTQVMTIGSEDEPLPANYDTVAAQKDLDVFRLKHATLAESRLRAKKLAQTLE